ncbi:MAG: hypothetical protein ACRD2J_01115 [Thermoanaerobaculia bacterium]
MLTGCGPTLAFAVDDITETIPLPATCSSNQNDTVTFTVVAGDGTLSPPAGQPLPVSAASPRQLTTFTPSQTGRSRWGRMTCMHSNGRSDSDRFAIRERVSPTIVAFAPPATIRVGQTVQVLLSVTDDPTGPGGGNASGLDYIEVTTTGPLDGPGKIELAGVPPGPPTDAAGPAVFRQNVAITCRREGEGTLRIFTRDAATNQVLSPIHQVACVP